MQISINKVRITDTQSENNDQLVDLTITDGFITSIKPVKKTSGKIVTTIHTDGTETWKSNSDTAVYVSQGWVDVFADYREPGFEQKETIDTGLNAAAAGGFTDVLLVPNTQPSINSKSIIQFILNKAEGNAVSLHPMGCATQNAEGKELAEMLDMRAHGAVAFTDGWKPVQSANLLLKALEYVKSFDGTIVQLPIDAALASGGLMHEGIVSTALGMPGIPTLAETLMVYRDIELVRYTGSRLHITGVSCADSIAMIKKAKAEGLAVTCSVTPYHLLLTDEVLKSYDSAYKTAPPLRGEADRQALIAALADGTIDCIATHHRPHEWDAKMKEFEYAAEGMAIQELAFNILWQALSQSIGVERLSTVLSAGPRNIFNLPLATLKKGTKASLTLFATNGHTTLKAASKRSAAMNNPFIGQQLPGSVIGIFNNNKLRIKE